MEIQTEDVMEEKDMDDQMRLEASSQRVPHALHHALHHALPRVPFSQSHALVVGRVALCRFDNWRSRMRDCKMD
jgi:hypothetical protein